MSHSIIETATFDIPVTVPDSGDARTAASVNGPFQTLADRTNYLKLHMDTIEAFTLDPRVSTLEGRFENGLLFAPGNCWSTDFTHIVVGSIVSLDVGGHHFGEQPNTTVTPTLLANSTWHYLYAFNNSGTLDFEASTTGPAANLRWKTGDATRRYICSFYVDGSAQIAPFQKMGNSYLWIPELGAAVEAYAAVGTSSPSTLALGSFMSPVATRVGLDLRISNTSADPIDVKIRKPGASGDRMRLIGHSHSGQQGKVEFEMYAPGRNLEYEIAAAGGLASVQILVTGYCE